MEAQIAEIRLPVAPKLGEIAIPQQLFRSDREAPPGPLGEAALQPVGPTFEALACGGLSPPQNDVAPLLRRITDKGAARGQIGGRPFFAGSSTLLALAS